MRIELPTDRFYLSRHYGEAVAAAGGAPLHISLIPEPEYISSALAGLDGILLFQRFVTAVSEHRQAGESVEQTA